jgi:hypothetical protein
VNGSNLRKYFRIVQEENVQTPCSPLWKRAAR